MVEIIRKLNYTEVNYGLIQVPGYRDYFPEAGGEIIVVDKNGQKYPTHMHNAGQPRIDGLTRLLKQFNAEEGDTLIIQIDPENNSQILVDIKKEDSMEKNNEVSEAIENTSSGILITPPLESILEDFIVNNLTELEDGLSLYIDEDGIKGRQYPTDVGNIDLLCKDKEENFVVLELKKGRESDRVIGQISRYMGWIKKRVCKENEKIRGIIIVHKPTSRYPRDEKLEYAIEANDYIDLRYYEIQLQFLKS